MPQWSSWAIRHPSVWAPVLPSHSFPLLWNSPRPAHLFWVSSQVCVRAPGQSSSSQTSPLLSPNPRAMLLTARCLGLLSPWKREKEVVSQLCQSQGPLLLFPLLVDLALLYSIPSPLTTQDSPQRDPAGAAKGLQFPPQALPLRSAGPGLWARAYLQG